LQQIAATLGQQTGTLDHVGVAAAVVIEHTSSEAAWSRLLQHAVRPEGAYLAGFVHPDELQEVERTAYQQIQAAVQDLRQPADLVRPIAELVQELIWHLLGKANAELLRNEQYGRPRPYYGLWETNTWLRRLVWYAKKQLSSEIHRPIQRIHTGDEQNHVGTDRTHYQPEVGGSIPRAIISEPESALETLENLRRQFAASSGGYLGAETELGLEDLEDERVKHIPHLVAAMDFVQWVLNRKYDGPDLAAEAGKQLGVLHRYVHEINPQLPQRSGSGRTPDAVRKAYSRDPVYRSVKIGLELLDEHLRNLHEGASAHDT
jgi:hypothetical protein